MSTWQGGFIEGRRQVRLGTSCLGRGGGNALDASRRYPPRFSKASKPVRIVCLGNSRRYDKVRAPAQWVVMKSPCRSARPSRLM